MIRQSLIWRSGCGVLAHVDLDAVAQGFFEVVEQVRAAVLSSTYSTPRPVAAVRSDNRHLDGEGVATEHKKRHGGCGDCGSHCVRPSLPFQSPQVRLGRLAAVRVWPYGFCQSSTLRSGILANSRTLWVMSVSPFAAFLRPVEELGLDHGTHTYGAFFGRIQAAPQGVGCAVEVLDARVGVEQVLHVCQSSGWRTRSGGSSSPSPSHAP